MCWNFAFEQRHSLRPAGLAEIMQGKTGALAGMHRRVALHVGKGEIRLAVAAIGRAKQGEQSGILRDRQELPVTERPALRREIEGIDADFGNERIHGVLSGLGREEAEQRDDEVETEIRLEIVVRLAAANG